ncbi:chlorophyll synthesis pathway protein BchC [Plastoroseomonas arctica]|uniref:Chlorophyll synthesis pathway protein BchC n=1 Tax=Plastoroseomonas arctica TaxID=1509237 RepID=A0AAF1KHJ7_9PROT|nr:chlorophyll synthesis pathway protein BchC [Plastoroseomonas arctica]MBR0654029.1 chlorophyll synthesis pathway protein BchC [Plastoroseomonas arctica]
MNTVAVVLREPEQLELARVTLAEPGAADVVVDVEWSGISTGTERLLWTGKMPMFPGMGYPLVPGYETVGRVREAGSDSGRQVGERVFVPGSKGFSDVRGLFGGAAQRVILPGARATPIAESLGDAGVLLALAATAQHAIAPGMPDLIVGHGVLGRLIARLVVAHGAPAPTVWEVNPARAEGAIGYSVIDPAKDERRNYRCICDVSGSPDALDTQIARLAPGGEIILAGFYSAPLSFSFPPAFMREARIRIAAEWQPADLVTVTALLDRGALSLDGLITHRVPASDAAGAYRTAFEDPACLKMILDWRDMP